MNRLRIVGICITVMISFSECAQDCTTPRGSKGKCVALDRCNSLKKILNGPRPMSPEDIEKVKKSTCKGDADYNVCCDIVSLDEILPKKCGVDEIDDRIVGGDKASVGQFPWTVILELDNGVRRPYCGGSLITSMHVITAAHCRHNDVNSVLLGEHNTRTLIDCDDENNINSCNTPPLRVYIEDFLVPDKYETIQESRRIIDQGFDIAIIKLEEEVKFTDYIKPICLPLFPLGESEKFEVAGWGFVDNKIRSDVKMYVTLPYVPTNICQTKYSKHLVNITWSNVICAGGEEGKDSCKGDSGGPLMQQKRVLQYLVGVVSVGFSKCGELDKPGLYTKVYNHLDWIKEQLTLQ